MHDEPIETFDLAHLKSATIALINSVSVELDDRLSRLSAFGVEDPEEMLADIRDRQSAKGEDGVVYEWHESALVFLSGVLDPFAPFAD